jgi:hypothetical protein
VNQTASQEQVGDDRFPAHDILIREDFLLRRLDGQVHVPASVVNPMNNPERPFAQNAGDLVQVGYDVANVPGARGFV